MNPFESDEEDELSKVEILHLKPLSECRKDLDIFGDPETKVGFISEWATYFAMSKYKVGDFVSCDELAMEFNYAMTQQGLDDLVDRGFVTMSLGEDCTITYAMTKEGNEWFENKNLA